jgi:hypothetical protein
MFFIIRRTSGLLRISNSSCKFFFQKSDFHSLLHFSCLTKNLGICLSGIGFKGMEFGIWGLFSWQTPLRKVVKFTNLANSHYGFQGAEPLGGVWGEAPTGCGAAPHESGALRGGSPALGVGAYACKA